MAQTVYSVTITNSNSNSSPRNGFVDNLKIEDYYASAGLKTTPSGLDYNLCKAKRRGNMRYRDIIAQLNMICNISIDELSITSDAGAKTEATSFTFYIAAEHGDAAFVTEDETSPGTNLTGTDCIKRCVARALFNDMTREIDVFDPTSATTVGVYGAGTSIPRYGIRIAALQSGKYGSSLANAESVVTVEAVDLTALSF